MSALDSTSLSALEALSTTEDSLPIGAGQSAVITVRSVETSRCESVAVRGVITQVLFENVGACGGIGRTITIGPAAAAGFLHFYFSTSNSSSDSTLEDRAPDYTVGIDDGIYDQDFDDVILSVALGVIGGVDCGVVERGRTATCQITSAVDTVLGWGFAGVPWLQQDTFYVTGPTSGLSWSGVGVLRGRISAVVLVNGVPDTLVGLLVVDDRPWSWASQWTLVQDLSQDCGWGTFYLGDSVLLGLNSRISSCRAGSIDPPVDAFPDSGFVTDSVRGGPNDGLWYVTAVRYRMERGSSMNPFIRLGGKADTLTASADKSACRRALGLGPKDPVVVNFYTYNAICQALDLTPMFNGIWSHEGFGTKGLTAPDANGHEARRRQAASQPDNDPYLTLDRMVLLTGSSLRLQVLNMVSAQDQRISVAADPNHLFVKNNWCGDIWVLDKIHVRYVKTALLQDNGSCE